MQYTAESVETAGLRRLTLMNNDYYYNGDDWRLFDPNKYNTVTLSIKDIEFTETDGFNEIDQIDYYVQKIKNRPF